MAWRRAGDGVGIGAGEVGARAVDAPEGALRAGVLERQAWVALLEGLHPVPPCLKVLDSKLPRKVARHAGKLRRRLGDAPTGTLFEERHDALLNGERLLGWAPKRRWVEASTPVLDPPQQSCRYF